jgi:phosphoserine aminotransferase
MISFYPGPSRVHDKVPAYVKDAYKLGIMSVNHRSEDFIQLSKKTISLLKSKLGIPRTYTVFFTSSATECWEIIAQSLVEQKSFHFHNGAFGQKWYDYTKRLCPGAASFPFEIDDSLNISAIAGQDEGIICLTQNETSNGTQIPNSLLAKIKKNNINKLLAIDATSSMGGIRLDFKSADIWFASVQKCFGLPAGLGLMICSPSALARAATIGEKNHYNSMTFMMDMMQKWQTSFTPNVLGIYLLMRVLEDSGNIESVEKKLIFQYEAWCEFLSERKTLGHLVYNKKVRSYTVIPVKADEAAIDSIKKNARKNGILLGEGYGAFKPYTFRIANFPAISGKEINTLKSFLKNY